MITFSKSLHLEAPHQRLIQSLKLHLTHWIQREIIDDDPYDELTFEEAALMTRLSLRQLLGLQRLARS